MIIRPETPDDINAIREINTLAFGRPGEAQLVDLLRSRFGFTPAKSFGLHCKWDAAGDHFMIRFPSPTTPPPTRGLVQYHPAFDTVT